MKQGMRLDEIVRSRRSWVAAQKRDGVEGVFKAQALALPLPPSFHDALRVPRAQRAVIAELRGNGGARDVVRLTHRVLELGVSALAITSEGSHLEGCFQDVLAAAQVTSVPILCVDVVLDPLQLYMARAHGASAVVLNASVLPDKELRALFRQAVELGLDVVMEIHTALQLETVHRIRLGASESSGARIVSVNCCNPQSGEADRTVHHRLAPALPEHVVRVAQGCPMAFPEVRSLESMGYDAFYVDCSVDDPMALDKVVRSVAGETLSMN